MLCAEYALLSSLLSATLYANTSYEGTQTVYNTPAAYFNDPAQASGVIDITLPPELAFNSFLWNQTFPNGTEVGDNETIRELNVTLRDHAFRLRIELPSGILFNISWTDITLHSSIIPLSVIEDPATAIGQPLTLASFDLHPDSWYLDFAINASHSVQDDLVISIPYHWAFDDRLPGFYAEQFELDLIPFDWSYKETSSNLSYYNLSVQDVSQPMDIDLTTLTLRGDCMLLSAPNGTVESYDGQLNCSRCISPNPKYIIRNSTEFNVIQIGSDLGCGSQIVPNVARRIAGDTINFTLTIKHNPWSHEDANQVLVELDSGVYGEITLLSTSIPLSNGTSQTIVFVPADARTYTINVTNYFLIGEEIILAGSVTLRDSLPLGNKFLFVNADYTWTSDMAGGEIFHSTCIAGYRTEKVNVDVSGDSYLNIPAEWSAGEEADVMVSFQFPAGTVNDVFLDLEFDYDDALMEVELLESTVTKSDPSIIVSEPLLVTYPLSVNRRRRALGTTTRTINLGTVVNPASNGALATITISGKFQLAQTSTPLTAVTSRAVLHYAAQQGITGTAISTTVAPDLTITKLTKYGSMERKFIMVSITVDHSSISTGAAHGVVIKDLEKGFNILSSSFVPSPSSIISGLQYTLDGGIRVDVIEYNLTAGPISLTFEAEALDQYEFPMNIRNNTAQVSYKSSSTMSGFYNQRSAVSCTVRNNVTEEEFLYQHGITALAVIIGFILGLVLVPLIIVLVAIILKKTKRGFGVSVQPSATDYRAISKQKRNNALLLDPGQKLKQGFVSAMTTPDESIISLLVLRDKFTTNRELDNLDIQGTIEVDKRMEAERLLSMDNVLDSLFLGMVKNRDITRQQYDQRMVQFRKSTKELDVKLTAEFSVAMEQFTSRQAMHNRSKLGGLLDKQRVDKSAQLDKVRDMSDEDRKELVRHIDMQCQIEQDDLSYKLKLEQDEEAERLRKEFSFKKRIQTKELQQAMLNSLREKAEMPKEMATWLMKEHAQNVANLEKIHDDELCRQKLVLEEKLAKRRALAELSDTQERSQSELLNTIAGGQMDILKKAKKQKILTAEEARIMSNEIMGDLVSYKQSMEADMASQESALHKKLSDVKKIQLGAKAKEQNKELAEFEKRCAQQQQSGGEALSPLVIAEERLQLVAKHEIDKASTEIQIDQENATQLKQLRDQMNEVYKGKLIEKEKKLLNDLKSDGLRDEQITAILEEHNSEIEIIESRQQQQYQQQDENLKMKLKKRRRDWEKRMQQEQEEKSQFREQEAIVVDQLIDSQFTMSADEREKIMREHEKNMVRLENSLTLNKLRQRQLLEQKLADRRAKRMHELEQSQLVAAKKTERKHLEDDEDDQQMATIELLKSQAEERVAVLSEEDSEVNFDEELEKVKLEILQQRAVALREQEDRLGGMVAQLQLNKAKELTEIDEKQRAINELKANLIDDLSDRGMMSDVEAEQCLEKHRAQQEKLTTKLNTERDKQEKMLKKKLADRLQVREKTLMDGYEDRLQDALNSAPNKIAAKLKKAAVLHKRKVAVEEFQTKMEKEISQSLEEMRREHTVKKAKLVQELELRFIASLVKQDKLKRSELKSSLKMLFPGKTDKQLEELINVLHDDSDSVPEDESDLLNTGSASMLKERIARSVSLYQGANLGAIEEEGQSRRSRPKSSRKSLQSSSPLDLDYRVDNTGRQRLPPLKPVSAKRRSNANYEEF